jgi:hypothetical protein
LWTSILRLLDNFKGMARTDFASGDTILFWQDLWNGHVLKLSFPQLHSYAKNDKVSVFSILQLDNIQNHFKLPLSEVAYEQYCELMILLQSLPAEVGNDVWSYIWGNREFSIKKAYTHLMGSNQVHPAFKWIWKSRAQMKQKVFFWLLLQNRLNTRGMLQRRNMVLDSYTWELCLHQRVETLRHLFLRFPFAKNC